MALLRMISRVCKVQISKPQIPTSIASQHTVSKKCDRHISNAEPSASRLITTVEKAQSIIGYNFTNSHLLWKAFQAPNSFLRSDSDEIAGLRNVRYSVEFDVSRRGHKVLATLGDAVLKLVLVESWYKSDDNRRKTSNTEEWPMANGKRLT